MLPRPYRLPARTRLNNPQVIHTNYFTMKIGQSSLPLSRFGFVISKRVAKSAVDRNTSKRKLRACLEHLILNVAPGFDVLFLIRQNLADVSTVELQEVVLNICRTKGIVV